MIPEEDGDCLTLTFSVVAALSPILKRVLATGAGVGVGAGEVPKVVVDIVEGDVFIGVFVALVFGVEVAEQSNIVAGLDGEFFVPYTLIACTR